MALRATWQCHAVPSERLRGAEVTRVHIYIYRNYKGYSTYKHSVFGIYANLISRRLLYTRPFLLIYPCGTKFHTEFKYAGDLNEGGSSDQMTYQTTGVDHVDSWSTAS